jgi:hypothetical protein
VHSETYRRILVAYIDGNPCSAGVVGSPSRYPYCSAFHYARTSGPRWLCRDWVESQVIASCSGTRYSPKEYRAVFGNGKDPEVAELVRARLAAEPRGEDPLDELLTASSERVLGWMRRKALLADGTKPGVPLVSLSRVRRCLRSIPSEVGELLLVGLGRDYCGARLKDLARELQVNETTIARRYEVHRREMLENEAYATKAAELLACALHAGTVPGTFPPPRL